MSAPIDDVLRIVQRIRPMLASQLPEVVGAVFAELVSTWLAGHWSPDPGDREKMRREQLDLLVESILQLIPMQERSMREQGRFPDAGAPA